MNPSPTDRDPVLQSFLTLSVPNVADALDHLDIQAAPAGIGPLWPDAGKVVGRAATVRLVPADEAEMSPVRGTLEAIREAAQGSVLVIDHGGSTTVNSFGGVAAFTAARAGLAGCVIDGVTRDVDEMRAIHFPVYGRGVIQLSVRGRCACAELGTPVQLAGVVCRPGDVVFGDENGIVVVPESRAGEVLELAHAFLAAENRIKDAIAGGMDPIVAHDQYGYDRLPQG